MTREESVTVLKAFMDNPLFSDMHKAVFSIAIHDIKQRHDWDINKLMLVPKTETELEQEPVLDKIRAEIENDWQLKKFPCSPFSCGLRRAIEIIDKYKGESEG